MSPSSLLSFISTTNTLTHHHQLPVVSFSHFPPDTHSRMYRRHPPPSFAESPPSTHLDRNRDDVAVGAPFGGGGGGVFGVDGREDVFGEERSSSSSTYYPFFHQDPRHQDQRQQQQRHQDYQDQFQHHHPFSQQQDAYHHSSHPQASHQRQPQQCAQQPRQHLPPFHSQPSSHRPRRTGVVPVGPDTDFDADDRHCRSHAAPSSTEGSNSLHCYDRPLVPVSSRPSTTRRGAGGANMYDSSSNNNITHRSSQYSHPQEHHIQHQQGGTPSQWDGLPKDTAASQTQVLPRRGPPPRPVPPTHTHAHSHTHTNLNTRSDDRDRGGQEGGAAAGVVLLPTAKQRSVTDITNTATGYNGPQRLSGGAHPPACPPTNDTTGIHPPAAWGPDTQPLNHQQDKEPLRSDAMEAPCGVGGDADDATASVPPPPCLAVPPAVLAALSTTASIPSLLAGLRTLRDASVASAQWHVAQTAAVAALRSTARALREDFITFGMGRRWTAHDESGGVAAGHANDEEAPLPAPPCGAAGGATATATGGTGRRARSGTGSKRARSCSTDAGDENDGGGGGDNGGYNAESLATPADVLPPPLFAAGHGDTGMFRCGWLPLAAAMALTAGDVSAFPEALGLQQQHHPARTTQAVKDTDLSSSSRLMLPPTAPPLLDPRRCQWVELVVPQLLLLLDPAAHAMPLAPPPLSQPLSGGRPHRRGQDDSIKAGTVAGGTASPTRVRLSTDHGGIGAGVGPGGAIGGPPRPPRLVQGGPPRHPAKKDPNGYSDCNEEDRSTSDKYQARVAGRAAHVLVAVAAALHRYVSDCCHRRGTDGGLTPTPSVSKSGPMLLTLPGGRAIQPSPHTTTTTHTRPQDASPYQPSPLTFQRLLHAFSALLELLLAAVPSTRDEFPANDHTSSHATRAAAVALRQYPPAASLRDAVSLCRASIRVLVF